MTAEAFQRVSTLELFFDLVFVFTITQVSTVVVESPSGVGIAQASIQLGVIYWMYDGYAWITNAAGPDTWRRTLVLLIGMAGFFVCAIAVPHAFGEDGPGFAAGYLVITLAHLVGLRLRPGATSTAILASTAPARLASAGLIVAAAFVRGGLDWVLWGGALAIQIAAPMLTRKMKGLQINAAHFAERHGCMILIVLGESLVSVGLAARNRSVDLRLILGATAGLSATAAMWWAYFIGEDARAAQAFQAAPPKRQVIQAVTGYELASAVMIYGVIALAAAMRLRIDRLMAPTPPFEAWLTALGALLFLLGSAGFRLALGIGSPRPRLLGAFLCFAAVPAALYISAAAGLAAVAIAIAITLGIERYWERRMAALPA